MSFSAAAMLVFKNNRRFMRKTVAFSDWNAPRHQGANLSEITCPSKSPGFQQRMRAAQSRGRLDELRMYALSMVIVLFVCLFFLYLLTWLI
ncbi:MAG: hypothetical protein AAF985_13025 [Bacteroidota bacterium]